MARSCRVRLENNRQVLRRREACSNYIYEFTLAVLIMECKKITKEVEGPVRKPLQ